MSSKVFPLAGNQRGAVNPRDNVWLSASAGTGKTQVLSARVLRLLLRPQVEPGQILCLTFTKAGAAEMANRINAVLARWVRLEPAKLAGELDALGADMSPETQARARTLFASVLDCPGGGLRIDTIHAFSQWLLTNFPEEADVTPGARPMEDRDRVLLSRSVLGEMLQEARNESDTRLLDASELFTLRKDPGALQAWLMRCAAAPKLWEGKGAWQSPMGPRVRRLLGIPVDADETWATEGLHPDVFPDDAVQSLIAPLEEWGTKTANKCLVFLAHWLSLEWQERIGAISGFRGTILKADGSPALNLKKPREAQPHFAPSQELIADALQLVEERQALLNLAELLTAAMELGRAFAVRWSAAKRREGLLDFDDLIARAAKLLGQSEAAQWIRYKLDRRFDHILIDEAQDTNSEQWDIVFALIDDFFAGEGASGDLVRTLFTVGDYKQAIFGFQGTSPENFARAREKVAQAIERARRHGEELQDNRQLPNWQPYDLDRSFRTSAVVLEFVNRAIAALGHEAFGLKEPPPPHIGAERPGLVTLLKPVQIALGDEEDDERDWLAHHDSVLAERIAEQVHRWVSGAEPFVLAKGEKPRHAGPGDIMVLVRKRRDLAAQIVAKLHERAVPVAGVDRLRLGAPLAVRDVLSALRFSAQPLDDLECANLLTSPLMGWSQDDLLDLAPRSKETPLWHHLRNHGDTRAKAAAAKLRQLLARADFETPQALIAWLLTGEWQGRARLVSRLGREANDPLDELLNTAAAFETGQVPSLAGFIEWFDAGTADLKRDPDDASGLVRVMTVHGSKGLQAPIVILADATGDVGQGSDLTLPDDPVGAGDALRDVPLPALAKDERVGPIRQAEEIANQADEQEHWRLLYVAMTRAEEALFIGGSLSARQAKKGVPEDSWYARLEPVFEEPELADSIWGARREWGYRAEPLVGREDKPEVPEPAPLPAWATMPIGEEPRPPKPLAPSSAGEDQSAEPPINTDQLGDGARANTAARRGVLMHSLLERLPDVAVPERPKATEAWLERHASELSAAEREEILTSALSVLSDDRFAHIFDPRALAEVPLTARVGELVVTGTVDRLLVEADRVTVVDYKTTRRPPASSDAIPASVMRQMAAYVAALEVIYPGRETRAAVLYTHGPSLFEIDPALLSVHKKRLGEAQESYSAQHRVAY
ncbi:MAG: double-strand break repair helicase AddA [Pseudomonadota bacterium]